jgi:hypothetical protein
MSFLPHPYVWLGVIVGLSIVLMLVRAWRIPEAYWIGGGVFLLLLLRLEPVRGSLRAAAKGTFYS